MWGKKQTPWYSPTAYIPSYKKRQKYNKMVRHTVSKNLHLASRNLPFIGAVLLGMLCLLLAKRVAQRLHMARLRWQYSSSTGRSYSIRSLRGRTPKKQSQRSRRRSHLKYSQNYQKEEEDKIIPYSDVMSVFAQAKTPPPRTQLVRTTKQQKADKHYEEEPQDKENSENGQVQASARGDGRPALREMR